MTAKKRNENRWRCLVTGCNPKLFGEGQANEHKRETGHRIARWPVRSPEGKRKERLRNKTGYYDKYNTGNKSWAVYQARKGRLRSSNLPFGGPAYDYVDDEWQHPFSPEALGQD